MLNTSIWNGGTGSEPNNQFQRLLSNHFKNAGWEYVASEGGRPGDLSYMKQFFKGYVKLQLRPVRPLARRVQEPIHGYEQLGELLPSRVALRPTGATQAAARGIQGGIMAGLVGQQQRRQPDSRQLPKRWLPSYSQC